MSTSAANEFWQAKIWGLLHDPLLKSLYKNKNQEGIWEEVLKKLGNPNPSELEKRVRDADFIAAASDRPSWDQDNDRGHVDYKHIDGLHVSHLLSGNPQSVVVNGRTDASNQQDGDLKTREAAIILDQLFRLLEGLSTEEQHEKAFWWLWRCLPVALAKEFGDNTALLPADTRIPDCSVWSHNSSVAALAGSLVGLEQGKKSRPYLVIFTMTPVQEMIKASRKMQDFGAGSWLLHYLSAKVCWKWAEKYGPDSLVYPSLYAQPLIDHWLIKRWADFDQWVEQPSSKQLLAAGFPNVLVAVLPEQVVCNHKGNALAIAEGVLREVWLELGNKVWEKLPRKVNVNKERLWDNWLKHQWQTYWTAVPLGNRSPEPEGADALTRGQGPILTAKEEASPTKIQQTEVFKEKFLGWVNAQNKFCQLQNLNIPDEAINPSTLAWNSSAFEDKKTCPTLAELTTYRRFNVGLWWAYIYDQLRRNLASVKNARSWQLPSIFSPRSTISGLGSVLHPQQRDREGKPIDWVTESITREFWQKERGWFDGIEELNATETLKRGLRRILPEILDIGEKEIIPAYPDLTVGVAGLLHQLELQHDEKGIQRYCEIGQEICQQFNWAQNASQERWGIPWIDDSPQRRRFPHPRLLSDGWLIEDCPSEDQQSLKETQGELRKAIQSKFPPGKNPTDWYVLAVGDGDDMGKWLQGGKLQPYQDYVAKGYPNPQAREKWEGVEAFLQSKKRMGPATHAALSRALLDFSNQLVPYLTEQRYAGRLIYSGGDDVLAYTNLWEWDQWLWDVRQCFKGTGDPEQERMQKGYANTANPNNYFKSEGDYWDWQGDKDTLTKRPLFTMGRNASISFGIVIAHHSVPLAIALENLWAAEKDGAKKHKSPDGAKKDAVQVRVLYGNGNILKATSKFDVFDQWKALLNFKQTYPHIDFDPALFEQAAEIWRQHPVPFLVDSPDPFAAIAPWTQAFCERRELFKGEEKESAKQDFQRALANHLKAICLTTEEKERDREVQNWLKLAAFTFRKRDIKIGGVS